MSLCFNALFVPTAAGRALTALAGDWVINGEKTSMQHIQWNFEKSKGQYLLHIATKPSEAEGEDLVLGYFELRDGEYSTDEVMKYRVFGSYTWKVGQLLLGAVPLENTELLDAVTEKVQNTTQAAKLRFPDELEAMGLYENIPEGNCPLRISLQVRFAPSSSATPAPHLRP